MIGGVVGVVIHGIGARNRRVSISGSIFLFF